jgi:hypothetical protein
MNMPAGLLEEMSKVMREENRAARRAQRKR